MKPFYHQVCSSDMVSQRWIDYYNSYPVSLVTSYLEFRSNAGRHFQILSSFCKQAQQTVNDSLEVFLDRPSIHPYNPASQQEN